MKVLKHGKMISHRCTCGLCGAELEYDFNDVEARTISYSYDIYYISCPECGRKLEVSDKIEDYFSNNTDKGDDQG